MSANLNHLAAEAAIRLFTLIETHARDAGRQLGEWLRPWLRDGEVLPDFALVLRLPARMIDDAGRRLRESDNELGESRSRESEARAWRDHQTSLLREKLVETRRLVTAVYGSGHAAEVLGVEGKTAQISQKARLLSQADAVAKVLRDPKRLSIPESSGFDPSVAGGALEPLLVAFREANGHHERVRRTSAARLEARNRARRDLDRGLRCVVAILDGCLGLIRRADLTEKLRLIPRSDT